MAIFCTKCGTSNEDGAGFCDNCGAPLRAALAKTPDIDVTSQPANATGRTASPGPVTKINPKKIIYAAAGLAVMLIVGGGASYFVLNPPAATASTLLAEARARYGKENSNIFKDRLCIANIDYSKSTFIAGQSDERTQAWMNVLVTAGLYSPPVPISSSGVFTQPLLQYIATPELAKFRQSSKLCITKDVEVAEVTDIGKPEESPREINGKPSKVLTVKTKLVLKSSNIASWMEKPNVREAVMATINGWAYKDKALQTEIPENFYLVNNEWIVSLDFEDFIQDQFDFAKLKKNSDDNDKDSIATAKSSIAGFASKLSGMFSFGNPLIGTWRTAERKRAFGSGTVPAGAGFGVTFTSDSMEQNGQSTAVDFLVDGKLVKVTPRGKRRSIIFILEDSNTMLYQVDYDVRYERVK